MKHLHQLTLTQQCLLIRKIHRNEVTATVKEDGSAVTVGFDKDGLPFVSRYGKEGGGDKFYAATEIPSHWPGASTALHIAAQVWCNPKRQWLSGCYAKGDVWNAEVVAPRLNVIDYERVGLILLHSLPNEVTSEQSTSPHALCYTMPEAETVQVPRWYVDQYDTVQRYSEQKRCSISAVRYTTLPIVDSVIHFLEEHSTRFGSNEYVLTVNLNKVSSEDREYIAGHRTHLTTRLKTLLRSLENGPYMLREGIVVNDNGSLVKLVSPEFVDTNQFYHAVRNCIKKRTFGNSFVNCFPTCPKPLIDDIDAMWRKEDRTKLETHQLRVMLYIMRDHYTRAQHQGKLRNTWKFKECSYPEYVHQATLVAFKAAIDSLDGL